MERSDIDSSILTARKNLRMIYEKYNKELYDVSIKIDKYLEALQTNTDEEVKEIAKN